MSEIETRLVKALLRAAENLSSGERVRVGPYLLKVSRGDSGRVWVFQEGPPLRALLSVNPDGSLQWGRNGLGNELVLEMSRTFRGGFTTPTGPAEPSVAFFRSV